MAEEAKPYAVVVPGPGIGHVNGCLLLAKALVSMGFSVTLVFFERAYTTNKERLNLPPQATMRVEILADGLPPLAGVPSYVDLFHVTPCMHQSLRHLLESQGRPPTCLIAHSFMAWTQVVADALAIPRVDYWTSNATSYFNLLYHPQGKRVQNPLHEDVLQRIGNFPISEVFNNFENAVLNKSPLVQSLLGISHYAKNAHCALLQSAYDLEREAFAALKDVIQIKTLPIGPLFHQNDINSNTDEYTWKWLNAHPPSSVIFVSFGSNYVHKHDEVVELAHGLDSSGKPFVWVLRSNAVESKCELNALLPLGFKERTSARGLIVPWVSQVKILGHSAIGGFLSHCGWNSTLESIWMGVPMLTCPKGAEQPLNSWLIAIKWGAGIELEPTISRHQVKVGVCALLDKATGLEARTKAKELSHALRKAHTEGGDSHSNLLKFLVDMKEQCLDKPTRKPNLSYN